VVPKFLKVDREPEPSVIRPLSCGTNYQSGFRKQTHSLPLRLGVKLSLLIKLIVRDGSGDPEASHSYAAVGLDYRILCVHFSFHCHFVYAQAGGQLNLVLNELELGFTVVLWLAQSPHSQGLES